VGGRRPYLQIGAVVAVAVAILGVGYLGPHPAQPSPSVSPSAVASPTRPNVAAASPASSSGPQTSEQLEATLGLPLERNVSGETATPLPLQISSTPAIAGNRLFYVVGGNTVEASVIGSSADAVKLVSVPHCKAINQIAATADHLMYLVSWPEEPNPTTGGCDTFTQIDWSLRLMDLRTGATREVAAGTRAKVKPEFDGFPIHFALTAASYAFDRPDDGSVRNGPETIEVHDLAGKPLWSTRSGSHVAELDLAGSRLSIVTQFSWPEPGKKELFEATAQSPTPQRMSEPDSTISMSPDGRYLVWGITLRLGTRPELVNGDVAMADFGLRSVSSAYPAPSPNGVVVMSPSVIATSDGPFVAWLAVGPDGTAYPAFNWPGRGRSGFLESVQQPIWMAVAGSSLVWVAASSDGWSAVAFSIDIDNL
jgi:hypothetical protein